MQPTIVKTRCTIATLKILLFKNYVIYHPLAKPPVGLVLDSLGKASVVGRPPHRRSMFRVPNQLRQHQPDTGTRIIFTDTQCRDLVTGPLNSPKAGSVSRKCLSSLSFHCQIPSITVAITITIAVSRFDIGVSVWCPLQFAAFLLQSTHVSHKINGPLNTAALAAVFVLILNSSPTSNSPSPTRKMRVRVVSQWGRPCE